MRTIDQSPRLLTSGGIETYLIYIQGVELRQFCGFDLYRDEAAVADAEAGFVTPIADAALATGHDLLLDALTWRAHADFTAALGYPDSGVEDVNRLAVARTRDFVARWRERTPGAERIEVFVNGDIGPRGDGYRFDGELTVERAEAYHRRQVEALAAAGADVISPLTMTNVDEAVALARLAAEVELPCIVSPTVETDGTTPDGLAVGDFIERVDQATGGSPLFYMVNCAHPAHLEPTLRRARERGDAWLDRFSGFRANASSKSHAELDASTELDRGQPDALAAHLARLQADFGLRLVGGCCGTDADHIARMAHAVAGPAASA